MGERERERERAREREGGEKVGVCAGEEGEKGGGAIVGRGYIFS